MPTLKGSSCGGTCCSSVQPVNLIKVLVTKLARQERKIPKTVNLHGLIITDCYLLKKLSKKYDFKQTS